MVLESDLALGWDLAHALVLALAGPVVVPVWARALDPVAAQAMELAPVLPAALAWEVSPY